MLARTLVLSVILTGSSLRIQQKEKKNSEGCPYSSCTDVTTDPTNPGVADFYTGLNPTTLDATACKNCRCFLAGFAGAGYSLASCGAKQQATTASRLGNHLYGCWGDYWEPTAALDDTWEATAGTLTRGRWSTLLQCLVNNIPVTPRAVINPVGVNPTWLDPIIHGAYTQQVANEIFARKGDNPGSLPVEECPTGLQSTKVWQPVCYGSTSESMPARATAAADSDAKRSTATFDGLGMCCYHGSGLSLTDDDWADTTAPTEAECLATANANTACKAYSVLTYRAKSTDPAWAFYCRCNQRVGQCTGSDDNYGATNGGRHHKLFKGLFLCQDES